MAKIKSVFRAPLFSAKAILLIVLLHTGTSMAIAQELEYLPPVINTKMNTDTGTSIILSTVDLARLSQVKEKKTYINSTQIIDACQSWPPRWYVGTPVYTDDMYTQDSIEKILRLDFILGPEVRSGCLSLCEVNFAAKNDAKNDAERKMDTMEDYVILNTKMERTDTIKSRMFDNTHTWKPDFRSDTSAERIWFSKDESIRNMTTFSGNERDNAVRIIVHVLHIIDNKNNVKFVWNPLDHIKPELFRLKDKLATAKPSDKNPLSVCQFNYASWDYDGNILYSIDGIGIGKISRKDGHIIWQANYCDLPQPLLNKDTISWTSAINFRLLSDNDTSALYSFFGLGKNSLLSMGVVFEKNKKTLKLRPVRYITPKIKLDNKISRLNFVYNPHNGDYIIGYGFFSDFDTTAIGNLRYVFEYGRNENTYALYQLPKPIYSYGAIRLQNYPLPPRPVITLKGAQLSVVWTANAGECTWYKLEGVNNTTITKVGAGRNITPEKGATYCVEAPYGIGFSVSKPYLVDKNNPY